MSKIQQPPKPDLAPEIRRAVQVLDARTGIRCELCKKDHPDELEEETSLAAYRFADVDLCEGHAAARLREAWQTTAATLQAVLGTVTGRRAWLEKWPNVHAAAQHAIKGPWTWDE